MAFDQSRGHAALRRGRFSQPAAEYFLTVCTDRRCAGLALPNVAKVILDEAHAMSADGTWIVQSLLVMPDHVHLLITLGERLSIAKAVQRLKAKTSAVLRRANLGWERGFYDRQLRPDDDRLAVFLYIYLNPYRAGLMPDSSKWPHYHCRDEEWAWLRGMLNADRPYPERLK
jgi:REP element-mobilizing transposase RayT